MILDDYYKIGHIIKSIGFKGEILVNDYDKKFDCKSNGKFLYLNIDEALIPFKIEKTIAFKNNIRLKLEDVNNKNDASRLKEKLVFLKKSDIIFNKEEIEIEKILNFEIIEKEKKLGKVLDYYEKKIQSLIVTEIDNKEVLIPYNNNIIKKIDYKLKKIFVDLPNGLIDI